MYELIILGVLGFFQSAAFSASGRSRASGDPSHHRKAALFSNGLYFITNVMIMKSLWESIHTGNYVFVAAAFFVYTLTTSEGSVQMMKHMLKTETGKRQVGAR